MLFDPFPSPAWVLRGPYGADGSGTKDLSAMARAVRRGFLRRSRRDTAWSFGGALIKSMMVMEYHPMRGIAVFILR